MRAFRYLLLGAACLIGSVAAAHAQAIGGNASLAVTTATGNVAIPLPLNKTQFPSVLIAPAAGTTQEIFYKLGTSSAVAAVVPSLPGTQGSPALPSGGICINLGPNTYIAAIVGSSTATMRITQLSGCTTFAGGSGGGGSGGSVTQGTSPWIMDTTGSGTLDGEIKSPIPTQATTVPIGGVGLLPGTSGGLLTYFLQPTASTNSVNVKATAGQVYWVLVENNSATVNYLRLYNTSSAPTCSSASLLITQIQIPASTSVGGVNIPLAFGIPFSTGIGICVTSGYATTDTTNATATAISLTIGYY